MKALLLILHLVAIATGTGMSFANLLNLKLAAAETGDRRAALAGLRRVLSRFGDGIIAIIWLTGVALWWHAGTSLAGYFLLKVLLVIVLTACHAGARLTAGTIARGGPASLSARLLPLAAGVWLSAVLAIACAVLAFGP